MGKRKVSIQTTEEQIQKLESRFKIVSALGWDLSVFPIKKNGINFDTDKDKSREFAEVFTPLHIVDEMIQTIPENGMTPTTRNLDLCAGYGQFSIRIIRKLKNESNGFSLNSYLRHNHFFNELQISSCFKLLWIFGTGINLAIGNALQLGKLPRHAKGVWYYLETLDSWIDITKLVKGLFNGSSKTYNVNKERKFTKAFDSIINRLEYTCEEYGMSIKKIIATKEGRHSLLRVINDASDGIEVNWQDKETPEWVVREMVNTIPDLKKLKKILVLFNIEFLECLVREKKINPKRIDFGYDSELEGLYASSVYKVNTFSLGKNFDGLVESINSHNSGIKPDVVFSNPPYQVMDEGHGASAGPIYNKIVEYIIDTLQPHYISMITPSRWMAGGKGLSDFRKRMLQDKRLRLIQDFPGTKDVFPNVFIGGGVNYFLWDKDYNSPCEFNGIQRDISEFDLLIRNNVAQQILKRILLKATIFCDKKILPRKNFGLPTNFKDWTEPVQGTAKCIIRSRKEKYVSYGKFTDEHGVQNKWKVCTPGAYKPASEFNDKNPLYVLNSFLMSPGTVCTETYIVIGSFKTEKEAKAYMTYTRTKFYRFMVSLRKVSQHLNINKFSWVPDLQNYSKAWTDAELYQHFGLTKKEVAHIEKTIKSLD